MTDLARRAVQKFPVLKGLYLRRRFPVERKLLKGAHKPKSTHASILHFSINKAATQYTKQLLRRCANENGLTPVHINGYAMATHLPFLDQLSVAEMQAYSHIFRPQGYLYSVFGGFVDGIPRLEDYRVVLVVRDPRDVLTSAYYSMAFSHPPPLDEDKAYTFETKRRHVRDLSVDQYVLERMPSRRHVYERYAEMLLGKQNVHLAKYEDMVSDFAGWLESILIFCDLRISSELKASLLREAAAAFPSAEDARRHMRQVLPGDHQRKLRAETIAALNDGLSQVLRAFGYA